MASTATGEMFTQEQVDAMTPERRAELDLVRLTHAESATLAPMTPEQRKAELKRIKNCKNAKRLANERERQNRRKARSAAR